MRTYPAPAPALALTLALLTSACWFHVEDYCAGCVTVAHNRVAVPKPAPGTHTQVVLVHGAFGFGDEWVPVVAALRRMPEFSFFAWTWPGPFRNPPRDALALGVELQALVNRLPPSVEEVLVLAHSAGGLLTNYAARQLKVRPGMQVTVALLDPALRPQLLKKDAYPPVPPGVTMTRYLAKQRPSAPPPPPEPAAATDLPSEYLGEVGHNEMVARVVLPLLAARRRGIRLTCAPGL